MYLVLIILLVLLAVGAVPHWGPYPAYGWYPSAMVMVLVLVLLVLLATGRL